MRNHRNNNNSFLLLGSNLLFAFFYYLCHIYKSKLNIQIPTTTNLAESDSDDPNRVVRAIELKLRT